MQGELLSDGSALMLHNSVYQGLACSSLPTRPMSMGV